MTENDARGAGAGDRAGDRYPPPEAVRGYLRATGWRCAAAYPAHERWVRGDLHIAVPLRRDYDDYASCLARALGVVAGVERRLEPWEQVMRAIEEHADAIDDDDDAERRGA